MTEVANLLSGQFRQIAYVTNDFDRALSVFRLRYGISEFLELRDIRFPAGPRGEDANCHVALARSGGMEIEIITPLSGHVEIYREPISDERFRIVFHHMAQKIDDLARFEAIREAWRESGTTLPVQGQSNGLTYFYADLRDTLGHFVEYVYGTPEYWSTMGTLIPEN